MEEVSKTRPIVPVIPTPTVRKRAIDGYLNDLVAEHPEYTRAVLTLISYPLLKWATDVVDSGAALPFPADEEILEKYREITMYIEETVSCLAETPSNRKQLYDGFCYVHGIGEAPKEVSLYYLRTFYPKAADLFFSVHWQQLAWLGDELDEMTDGNDALQVVTEDLETCRKSKVHPEKERKNKDFGEQFEKFPKDGEPVSLVFGLYAGGASWADILEQTGMSRNTAKRYLSVAQHGLAILKGCGIGDIVEMLHEEARTG